MSGLLVGEIALSVILLASAGLLIRSARALYAADQAIDVSNLVTARLSLPPGQYGTPQERIAFYEQLELRLASIPSIVIGGNRDSAAVLRRHEARRGARQRSRPGCGRHAIGSDARDWIAVLRDARIVPAARALVRRGATAFPVRRPSS